MSLDYHVPSLPALSQRWFGNCYLSWFHMFRRVLKDFFDHLVGLEGAIQATKTLTAGC